MTNTPFTHARAVAEIDTAALTHNFRVLQAAVGGRTVAVVKADAYGHTLELTVPALLAAGCDFFAVATQKEGETVRKLAPSADVLLLGYLPPSELAAAVRARLILTVFSAEYACALSAAALAARVRPRVHLKLDTGMHRLGLPPREEEILPLFALPALDFCGVFTHFPVADTDISRTREALSAFLRVQKALPAPLFSHAAASAAALSLPEARLDGTRLGIALYGYPPVPCALPLRRAMRVLSPVIRLQRVGKGEPVGYGGAFVSPRDTLIGTVPIGYADGILRALSGYSLTLLCEKQRFRAPIVGRVCMDHLMLDLGDIPAKEGQTVCVLEDFSAAAAHCADIPYELLTAVSPRVERRRRETP